MTVIVNHYDSSWSRTLDYAQVISLMELPYTEPHKIKLLHTVFKYPSH